MQNNHIHILDKKWLQNIISERETHLKNVSGALASEVISDAVVLGIGVKLAFAAASTGSLVPLAANPLPAIQLGLAYKTIKSLVHQRSKISNDLNVLNAILQVDEETPQNITAMLHDYIEIHANPDSVSHPSHLEVKNLSPDALIAIQKNFRLKKPKLSVLDKTKATTSFLCAEFSNAATMIGKTAAHPLVLGKAIFQAGQNIALIKKNWDTINDNRNGKTLRESYNSMLRGAAESDIEHSFPKESGSLFGKKRKAQLYYLHQQQASLRTVSRLRVDTAQGFVSCAGIVGIAATSMLGATSLSGILSNAYTMIASLPSLKVLGDELDDLTKTSQKYTPKVNRATADFIMDMPKVA